MTHASSLDRAIADLAALVPLARSKRAADLSEREKVALAAAAGVPLVPSCTSGGASLSLGRPVAFTDGPGGLVLAVGPSGYAELRR